MQFLTAEGLEHRVTLTSTRQSLQETASVARQWGRFQMGLAEVREATWKLAAP